jgi:hypothetical protein
VVFRLCCRLRLRLGCDEDRPSIRFQFHPLPIDNVYASNQLDAEDADECCSFVLLHEDE